jgi:nitrite reductase/ring-hydroxylating ferredoxin subunit
MNPSADDALSGDPSLNGLSSEWFACPKSGITRRNFVKIVWFGAASSSLFGKPWLAAALANPSPAAAGVGVLHLNISDFPALQNANGSVSLALTNPQGAFYPLLVNRGTGNQFFALSTRCTHQGCVVTPFSTGAGACVCPCHGSRFAIDGAVVGGPAAAALARYTNTFDGANTLRVQIPGLGYSITSSAVQTGAGPRLQLRFPTVQNAGYQVRFRQSIDAAWAITPFATTANGTTTNTILTGTGSPATVFVDRTSATGFYAVTLRATQV